MKLWDGPNPLFYNVRFSALTIAIVLFSKICPPISSAIVVVFGLVFRGIETKTSSRYSSIPLFHTHKLETFKLILVSQQALHRRINEGLLTLNLLIKPVREVEGLS
jgi:hypothetical protein